MPTKDEDDVLRRLLKTKDIVQFIESLGGLHDATLLGLTWNPADRYLEIEIEDIYWNFEGLPEYPGPFRAKFIFVEVSKFDLKVDLMEKHLMVHDWVFDKTVRAVLGAELLFSPAGKIAIHCSQINCIKC